MIETIPAKTIVTRNKSTAWFGAEYNMNLYKGCCHGCIYCDSRSDCYGVEEFDRVRVKEHALEVVRNDLRRKVRPGVVATGSMSDPYNPHEREQLLTRHALELLSAYGFGVGIATKSDLILRDVDLLAEIQAQSPVICKLTVTTTDDTLAAKLEPHVALPSARLKAVEGLAKAGIFTGLLLMPVLPFLEDNPANIQAVVHAARESGARFIYPFFGVTLRQNQRAWYYRKLDALFPDKPLRADYERTYGERYECVSPRQRELWTLFQDACNQAGLLYRMREIVRAYRAGYEPAQLSFFKSN